MLRLSGQMGIIPTADEREDHSRGIAPPPGAGRRRPGDPAGEGADHGGGALP